MSNNLFNPADSINLSGGFESICSERKLLVHCFPDITCIGFCSYQNIVFHPQQILSDTDTWHHLHPLKHTAPACCIPQDHNRHHLQMGSPSDYSQTSEEKMDFSHGVYRTVQHFLSQVLGQVNLQIKTLRWLISYIYIKGSTSHMFPFTCSERIFSLKDLCGVQGSLCELINNFLKAFANLNYKIARSKWTQISSFTAYLRIPNCYDIRKGSIHPCLPKDSQTNK